MNDIFATSATIGVVISLLAYGIGTFLKNKIRKSFVNPFLISMILVIVFLLIFDVEYDNYNKSAKYISYLLTPATVCLAVPLYRQIELLKKNLWAILAGIISGVCISLGSVLVLSLVFRLSHAEYVTLLPKSITTAIGMVVADELGGYAAITATIIAMTGVIGNMIAESVCKFFRIKSPIARGLAIGTSSHALGTSKAIEMGPIEGAMSSLSIVIAGLFTVILAPIFAMFY